MQICLNQLFDWCSRSEKLKHSNKKSKFNNKNRFIVFQDICHEVLCPFVYAQSFSWITLSSLKIIAPKHGFLTPQSPFQAMKIIVRAIYLWFSRVEHIIATANKLSIRCFKWVNIRLFVLICMSLYYCIQILSKKKCLSILWLKTYYERFQIILAKRINSSICFFNHC